MSDEATHELAVRLLGAVDVSIDGASIDIGGAQPRAIVAHLALEAGRVVSVDRLITRLWADDPPRTPLGTLQSYVSRLRRLIEPRREAGARPTVLLSEAPGYRLDIEPDRVDAHRFVGLAEEARRAMAGADVTAALAAADLALAVWRGEPLAGIGPDEQVRPLVLPLVELHAATVEDRFDALLALGRHGEAVPALQAAVDESRLRERRWGLLATALYRSGRQADALRSIGAVRTLLRDELGVEPGPELRFLEHRILDQDPTLLSDGRASVSVTTPPTGDQVPGPPERTTAPTDGRVGDRLAHVVGRHREWQHLVESLERTERGPARLVLLEGEAGIGKSTLVDALRLHATGRGWREATGRCVEPGLAPSLWPALEIVRALVADGAPGQAASNPLVKLVVGQALPTAALTSVELVDSFVDLLDALDPGPLMVVLDDLHWADQATLDVLAVAAQRLGARPVLVVAAFRPPEQVPGTILGDALGRLRRVPTLDAIVVSPLDVSEVAELMAQTAGAAPDTDVAEHVQTRTGGNPLFVVELARLAGERGVAGPSSVPEAIRDVVRERLARLPDRATAELEIAAVIGERFHLRTVTAASDRSADACLDALDAAIVTRILVPDGPDYRFAHALVRDAVLADITPVRLQRLHAGVADAIAATLGDGPDTAEPIAHHRLAARSILDPIVVAGALVRGADVARWKNALDEGQLLAEAALDVLDGAHTGPERSRIEVNAVEALISISYRRGNVPHDEMVEQIDRITARSRSESTRALVLFLRYGRVDEAEDLDVLAPIVDQARALVERTSEPYGVVTLRYLLCSWALMRGDPVGAIGEADLAFAASGSTGPDDPPVHVPFVMLPMVTGIAHALVGEADPAREHVSRRMRAWLAQRSAVDASGEQTVTFIAVLIEALLGEAERARQRASGYRPVGPSGQFPVQDAAVELMVAWAVARSGGAIDVDLAQRAMATIEAGPELGMQSAMRTFAGEIELLAGERRAVETLAVARSGATGRGEVWWLAEITRLQALADATLGDGTRVLTLLDEAATIAGSQGAALLSARIAENRRQLVAPAT